jgi:hypothetical protein
MTEPSITSLEALQAWERYLLHAETNWGTEKYTVEQIEQDGFTAGYDIARAESAERKALVAIRDAYEVAMEIRLSNDDDEFYCAIGEALNRVVDSDGNFSAVTVPTEAPTEEELAVWLHMRFGQNQSKKWALLSERMRGAWRDMASDGLASANSPLGTVPTENEREALSLIISNAVGGGNPNVRAITNVTDAIIAAGFGNQRHNHQKKTAVKPRGECPACGSYMERIEHDTQD